MSCLILTNQTYILNKLIYIENFALYFLKQQISPLKMVLLKFSLDIYILVINIQKSQVAQW